MALSPSASTSASVSATTSASVSATPTGTPPVQPPLVIPSCASLAELHKQFSDPENVRPGTAGYTRSPFDWRDEVFYFLLPDRFSDAQEGTRPLLAFDMTTDAGLKAILPLRNVVNFGNWRQSGGERFQGGTIAGITSKLDYLQDMGITTIWVGPVLRQRAEQDTYHGYAIQNFLDVDPRFGTMNDLIEFVDKAHKRHMKVVLDVIYNHTARNWDYVDSTNQLHEVMSYTTGSYDNIRFFTPNQANTNDPNNGIIPREMQDARHYVKAGTGNLGAGAVLDDFAEHKRTDFCNLRKINLYSQETLGYIIECYKWLISITDVDGFRIDTFKHTTVGQASEFTFSIKEFAHRCHKDKFFLIAECAGGDTFELPYSTIVGNSLDAVLDIGWQREVIDNLSKGLSGPYDFFNAYRRIKPNNSEPDFMGCLRNDGLRHVSIVNDHDHVSGPKIRHAWRAANDHQYTVAAALQLFIPGVPCVYYGSEQNLASGMWPTGQQPDFGSDVNLRETMFGAAHPLKSGLAGHPDQGVNRYDDTLPGYGPHMTVGQHVFNPKSPTYLRISALTGVRFFFRALRHGRMFQRTTTNSGAGELVAWTRVLDNEEVIIVANTNGSTAKTDTVLVDYGIHNTQHQEYFVVWYTGSQPKSTANINNNNYFIGSQMNFGQLQKFNVTLDPAEVLVVASHRAFASALKKFTDPRVVPHKCNRERMEKLAATAGCADLKDAWNPPPKVLL